MNRLRRQAVYLVVGIACAQALSGGAHAADAPFGGFIPFVGMGLTRQFDTFDTDPTGTFFIADPRYAWSGTPLGPGGTPYFDLALLDTGAATHILTQAAASASGFGIATPFSGEPDGFRGTNFQTIFGASGVIDLRINDPLGVYAGGLGHGSSNGATLTMNTSVLRGQSSFAMLEGSADWELPNILGLPMAAHHAISIRNDQPQIFQHQGRTVRTPNVEFIDLGTGSEQQILRRTDLRIRPSAGFLQGPFYVQNLDIFSLELHENPLSPSVIDSGAMFLEVDVFNGSRSIQDKELLFDTGADLTVISQLTAARLGIDVLVDQPDFVLEVEGAGGVSGGVPGFYLDELNIDTIGGSFTMQNVPVAVLDLPNPNDPANVLDGIVGMNLFTGRNLVIDANPAASPGGGDPPRLYIGDSVMENHSWATAAASGDWSTTGNWSAPGRPAVMWDARVANISGSDQTAIVAANSTVYRITVSGTPAAQMSVRINSGVTLTTYGETRIDEGGRIELNGGTLDTQFVSIEGGALAGSGEVFAGTGPLHGVVRNLSGRIEPGDPIGALAIDGDLSHQSGGTLAIDLAGTTAITEYDRLAVDRFAFLAGTLEVSLLGFTPSVGAMFTVLTAGRGVVGEFDNLLLPSAYQWDITYGTNDVMLTVVAESLAGDFNGDGAVDTADYVVWRKNGGSQQDYLSWKTNFGGTLAGGGSASGSTANVPEPACMVLIALASCGLVCSWGRLTRPVRSAASRSCAAWSAS
jgi:Aspartyl protease